MIDEGIIFLTWHRETIRVHIHYYGTIYLNTLWYQETIRYASFNHDTDDKGEDESIPFCNTDYVYDT